MFSTKFYILLLAFAGVCYCDVAEHEPVLPRLTGGANALVGEFPSTISLSTPTFIHCGGVIVNQWHVLTSCQCVLNATHQPINPAFFRITAGDLNIMQPSFRRFVTSVSHAFTHPQYNPNALTRNNDIAVLRVVTPFPFPHNTLSPAIRTQRVFQDGTVCRFGGWGGPTAAATVVNAVQQGINSPLLNRDACNVATVHAGQVLENMICSGTIPVAAPATGVCVGNLGGGLYCNNELVGILTFGLNCGAANNPGVYTQVRFHAQWIDEQFTRDN